MSGELSTPRQEYLQKLSLFCRALGEAFRQAGLGPEETSEVWRTSFWAECIQCGQRVSGEELLVLSRPLSGEASSAKIGRLRLGDCARQGCDSCYYQLTCLPHPRVDWPKLLTQADILKWELTEQGPAESSLVGAAGKWMGRVRLPVRFWIILGGILVVWLLRQWYVGGSIPLVREPEHFRVDPLPQAESAEGQGEHAFSREAEQ